MTVTTRPPRVAPAIDAPAARELVQIIAGDPITAAARLTWRFIGDGDPAVRAAADRAIDAGLELLEKYEDMAELGMAQPEPAATSEAPAAPAPASSDDELQKRITRDEMYCCDEAFFTGTAAEITPIRELDNRQIGEGKRGPITEKLQSLFFDVVAGKVPQYQHWLTLV